MFFINDKSFDFNVNIDSNLSLLQACLSLGFEVPKFCFHEKLTIAGNCRMCLVEVSAPKSVKPVASCAINLVDNMVIYTNTLMVKIARQGVLEFLLLNHPLDCPICDQGGECDLQDQTLLFGNDRGRFYDDKRVVKDKDFGPFIKTIMSRCIHCTRCVRFLNEIAGVSFLGVLGRGNAMEIGFYLNEIHFDSEFLGNLVDLCPVGALTSKPYAFSSRPWELRSFETISVFDSFCSRIRVDIRGLDIMRFLPSLNEQLNEIWICDKTRYSYDGLKRQRLLSPKVKFKGLFFSLSWEFIMYFFFFFINFFTNRKLIFNDSNKIFQLYGKFFSCQNSGLFFFFGDFVDVETIVLSKNFFSSLGNCFFFLEDCFFYNNDFRFQYLFNIDFSLFDKFDFCFFVNLNPRLQIPLLNLKLRKSFLSSEVFVVSFGFLINLTFKVFQNSINFFNFLIFLSGKYFLSKKLLFCNFPVMLFNYDFLNFFNLDYYFFFRLLHKYSFLIKKDWFGINFFFSKITNLNFLEFLNSFFFLDYFKHLNCYNLFFFFSVQYTFFFKFLINKGFSIYQGSHGDLLSTLCDVALPSVSFLEKNSFFFNLFGNIQKSKFVLNAPFFSRDDWRILFNVNLYNYLFNKKFFFERNFVYFFVFPLYYDKILNFIFINNLTNFFTFENNNDLILKLFLKLDNVFFSFFLSDVFYKHFFFKNNLNTFDFVFSFNFSSLLNSFFSLNNLFFISNISDYFISNIVSKSSKLMALASISYRSKQYNF